MYIIDKSFKEFYDMQVPNNIPFAYWYIPNKYDKDFYTKFNEIIDLLKNDKKYKILFTSEAKKKVKTYNKNFFRNALYPVISLNILVLSIFLYYYLFKK